MIAFACGFPEEAGFDFMSYYNSIKIFLNARPINSEPWSNVISIGHGCLVSQVVFTNSTIAIDFCPLLRYLKIPGEGVYHSKGF